MYEYELDDNNDEAIMIETIDDIDQIINTDPKFVDIDVDYDDVASTEFEKNRVDFNYDS